MTHTINAASVAHLYEGQAITIECLKRDDSQVSEERRDAFV